MLQPEKEFRRMLIFGAGNAGLGNLFAWGFALVLVIADLFNSADTILTGKIFATAVIGGIPIGVIWGLLFAAFTFYAGKLWANRPDLPSGSALPSFMRWWTIIGRAIFPLTWVTVAVCADMMFYEGTNMNSAHSMAAGEWILWLIKLAGIAFSFIWVMRLVKMSFGWGTGKAIGMVFASQVLALAVCFLIFVLILGIPIR